MTLTVGDTAPALTGTCWELLDPNDLSTKTRVNLAGADLENHISRPNGTVFIGTATPVDDGAGTWSMPWTAGDLTLEGTYRLETEVTFSDGSIQTFGPVTFYVRAQIL